MKHATLFAAALVGAALIAPLADAGPVPLVGAALEADSFDRWKSLGDGFTRSYDHKSEITSYYREKPAPSQPKSHEWYPVVSKDGRAFWAKEDLLGHTFYAAKEWERFRFESARTFADWHKAARQRAPTQPQVILTAGGHSYPADGILQGDFQREYKAGTYRGNGVIGPDGGEAPAVGQPGDGVEGGRCRDPEPGLLDLWGIPNAIAGIPTLMFILGLTVVIGGLGILVFFGLLVALIVWLCRRK